MPGTRLTQKVAIVTGGAHGVGRAIVTNFQDEGAHVYTAGRNREHRIGARASDERGMTVVKALGRMAGAYGFDVAPGRVPVIPKW